MKIAAFLVVLVTIGVNASLSAGQAPAAKPALSLEVYTSNDYGYATTSTIVSGAREAVLIDPQFLASDARKVAAMIKARGKTLTTIYTTHAHPDHFFGVAVIKAEFPNARYVALPPVAERIKSAWPARRTFWLPTYGNELPSEAAIVPEALAAPALTLEGETMPITGEVMGDGPGNSFVWIPSLQAVVAGDTVFYRRHIGVPADPTAWLETLDRIDALRPRILVSGHKPASAADDPAATTWLRGYIADFNTFRMQSKTGAELKAKMLAKYGDSAMPARLDQSIEAAFPPAR